MQNLAVSLARISISAAALCLALLALSVKGQPIFPVNEGTADSSFELLFLAQGIRLILAIVGLIFLASTAFFLDWLVDSFDDSQWEEMGEIAYRSGASTNENSFKERGNEFQARSRLFGCGYGILCLGISGLMLVMVWLLYYNTEFQSAYWQAVTTILSALFAIITFFRMMTKNYGNLVIHVTFLAIVLFLIVSAPFILEFFGL
jgi:hypothetical protein